MRKWSLAFLVISTLACGGLVAACGDDDEGNPAQPDSGLVDGPGGNETGPGDGGGEGGGDAGCTFATYVIGLINNSTTATAQPDTTLGAQCKDSTDQAEFKSLFP